jgi:hypothetical protein
LPEAHTDEHWRKLIFQTVPSWLLSLLLHTLLIVVLAMIQLDPIGSVLNVIQAGSSDSQSDSLEEFSVNAPAAELADAVEVSQPMSQSELSPTLDLAATEPSMTSLADSSLAEVGMESLTQSVLPRETLNANQFASMSQMLTSRSTAKKSEMLEKYGGTAQSEKSVALALKWLAEHQFKEGPRAGSWNFNHTIVGNRRSSGAGTHVLASNGATALALLPFLGAGQTHLEGQYQDTVRAGMAFLINQMKVTKHPTLPTGSLHEAQGNMYSHGLASIALCEAYAMTGDPDLQQPAQLALNFIVYAQDPRGGGWRYEPKQPGDTSVVGWCLMALKSGNMGKLQVPVETFVGANNFLNLVSTNEGVFYGYEQPSGTRRAGTTAIGLLCRMYLGWPREHVSLGKGVAYLEQQGPKLDDLYYSYYATQVMRHFGGQPWQNWNSMMRDLLIEAQVKQGSDAGSWEPVGGHSKEGGRLYQTALATMILEVYYRHLPIYGEQSLGGEDFEL